MKRFFCVILVLVMLVLTVSCDAEPGDKGDNTGAVTTVTQATTTTQATTVPQTTEAVEEYSYAEAYDKIYSYLLENGSKAQYELDAELRRANNLQNRFNNVITLDDSIGEIPVHCAITFSGENLLFMIKSDLTDLPANPYGEVYSVLLIPKDQSQNIVACIVHKTYYYARNKAVSTPISLADIRYNEIHNYGGQGSAFLEGGAERLYVKCGSYMRSLIETIDPNLSLESFGLSW